MQEFRPVKQFIPELINSSFLYMTWTQAICMRDVWNMLVLTLILNHFVFPTKLLRQQFSTCSWIYSKFKFRFFNTQIVGPWHIFVKLSKKVILTLWPILSDSVLGQKIIEKNTVVHINTHLLFLKVNWFYTSLTSS